MNSYIKYGWDKNVINPHVGSNQQSVSASSSATGPSPSVCLSQYDPPKDGWRPLKQAFSSEVPKFNNGHIVTYFVNRSVINGLPSSDFKGFFPIDQLPFDPVTFDQLPLTQLPLDYCAICPLSQLTNSHLITSHLTHFEVDLCASSIC